MFDFIHTASLSNAKRANRRSCAPQLPRQVSRTAQGFVEAGGLISYGFDRSTVMFRLASVAGLLMRGSRPGEIPVEQQSDYVMAVNLQTARPLGLIIPQTVMYCGYVVIEWAGAGDPLPWQQWVTLIESGFGRRADMPLRTPGGWRQTGASQAKPNCLGAANNPHQSVSPGRAVRQRRILCCG